MKLETTIIWTMPWSSNRSEEPRKNSNNHNLLNFLKSIERNYEICTGIWKESNPVSSPVNVVTASLCISVQAIVNVTPFAGTKSHRTAWRKSFLCFNFFGERQCTNQPTWVFGAKLLYWYCGSLS